MSTLFTISAPSGAGKTSLVKKLLECTNNIKVSVSHTTRKPRPGEIDGVNYNFVTEEKFVQMLKNNVFLEHAQVFDNYYGTSQEWLTEQLENGIDIILEIDWQGAKQVKHLNPATVGIFILPPSRAILEERLRGRGTDNEEIINQRLQGAIKEISHYTDSDYLVVNDDFEQALQDLQIIVYSQRLRQVEQANKLDGMLTKLLESS
ncbi:guanylate kinase [Candidatus Halobeggiatoa sp. HSG11]|nr:guanylate kinase [Candidatus Halobeggiatoa sp. HSG11]